MLAGRGARVSRRARGDGARHVEMESALHGARRGLLELRKHIAWYVSGLPGASHFRQSLNDLTEPDAVRDALCAFGQACEKNA